MILFPAIDLKNGECVRLLRGDMAQATVFNSDPAAQARTFAEQGFEYLHVVDLDGAFAGTPVNAEAVRRILSGLTMKMQLGGGVRDMKTVRGWLESGVTRVIIGTAAVRDPDFVREAARLYPDRIAVGIDARDGWVAVEGWAKTSNVSALDLGRRFEDAGVVGDHLHRYRPRRRAHRPQHREHGRPRQCRFDPRHRLRRPRLHRGRQAADRARLRPSRRRDRRPRALRWPPRSAGGAGAPASQRGTRARDRGSPPMTLKARVIPCLDVKDGRVVKGVNFVNLRDAGDPVESAVAYDRAGADELCFLDITASHEDRGILLDVVRRTAEVCFMPLTVGGGVRTTDDIRNLLLAGADKASINSAAVADRLFVRQAAEKFGSQCIVVAIDAKRVAASGGRRAGKSSPTADAGRPASTLWLSRAKSPNSGQARSSSPRWTATGRNRASTSS